MSLQNKILLLSVFAPIVYLILPFLLEPNEFRSKIATTLVVSILSFLVTILLIPSVKELTRKADLWGKDLNKGEAGIKSQIPESLGIVPGTVYVITVCVLQSLMIGNTTTKQNLEFNAGLFTICFMIFLGFADDVLDLRWRYKIILPSFAIIPVLLAYGGPTTIIMPKPLRGGIISEIIINFTSFFFEQSSDPKVAMKIIELGLFYHIYMLLVSIFCTNSINIYAGINGLEVGQSLIIGVSILIHNLVELQNNSLYKNQQLFSIIFVLPFIFVTLGLLYHNWYPSSVFVGDTFCYFSGMTLAVTGILGHFSKTLMLFFIPQWINFFLSVPQIFLPFIWPCPRHRLPIYDEKLKKLRHSNNGTLINLALYILGPTNEGTLCKILVGFQILCCAFGFYVKYSFTKLYY